MRSDERAVLVERVRALTEAGMSAPQIALELNIVERTVNRYRARAGVAQVPPRALTPEELRWLHAVRAEGMPATWVAETIGVSQDTVRRRGRMPAGARREWLTAWAGIRHNPTLLALHREFVGEGATEAAA